MRHSASTVLTLATLATIGLAGLATIGSQQNLSAQGPSTPLSLRAYYTHEPWQGGLAQFGLPNEAALQAAASGSTIPMSAYSITATKDNSARSGTIVGTSPFASPLTGTTISTVVVPLIVKIGSATFDPTANNSCDSNYSTVLRFNQSPLVNSVTNLSFNGVNVGTTQYVNGFRRAEFWTKVGGSSAYQNTLSPVITAAAVSVTTTSSQGIVYSSGCTQLGIVSYSWLSGYLRNTLLPSLTNSGVVNPSKFVIFLLRNVVQSTSTPPSVNTCCILGFHGATGNPVQTYSPMDWDTTGLFGSGTADGSVASHEIGEWMDDPLGTNPTPAWGNIGQVSGCQTNLEVGDPLSGTLMPAITLNGKAYHMQELGFFSWYFNKLGVASLGTGGKFSGNGKFAGPAKACPPGGTN